MSIITNVQTKHYRRFAKDENSKNEKSIQFSKLRTDHDRYTDQLMQEIRLNVIPKVTNASVMSNVNIFETERRKVVEFPGLALDKLSITKVRYSYFAANVNPISSFIPDFTYEGARERLKPINFDRKRPKYQATSSKPSINVDKQCEERRTAISRWRSFVDSSFWNRSRPRELAKQIAANGLFLLSRYDQFAVRLSERSNRESVDKVPANYELLPAPKRLKVRCAFCKRVFEVPYHSSFSFVYGQSSEPSQKNDDEAFNSRVVSASHFSADSHYATVCAIASNIRLHHERKSPSCPAVVGVKSDDERFSELSQSEQNSIALQIQTDPFYQLASSNCQAEQASKTDDYITPVEAESSISESTVTTQVEDLLFRNYKRLPPVAYSDAMLLCPDDHSQFGTWHEYELNGRARFGDPTRVFDDKCLPIEPDQPAMYTIYDDFSSEPQRDPAYSEDGMQSKSESDNVSCLSRRTKSSGYYTDSHSNQDQNVALNDLKNFTVNRCDDEVQCGYESPFEQVASQEPSYAPFRSADLRLETFEADSQISNNGLSLRAYLAIYMHERSVNFEDPLIKKKNFKIDELRIRIGDSDWPFDRRRLFERLAEAGFFSLRRPESDVCVCFWCGMALSCWHDKADAYVEHARHLRDGESCAYLYYQRGAQFIIDARNHYPLDMAGTERVDINEFSELLDSETDCSLLERLQVGIRKPSGTASLELKARKSKPISSHATEIPYDPVISFRTTGVSYRVEEREVRARKDLRLVRNLIFLCGAQPLAVSFAMERRLKTTMTDFVNARQFLEALWDVEARMRTLRITDIVRFQQLLNQTVDELNRSGSSSQSQDFKPSVPASKLDSMIDAHDLKYQASAVTSTGVSVTTSHSAQSTASSGVSSMISSSDCTDSTDHQNDRQKMCSVCDQDTRTVVVMPCNHLVLCDNCMKRKQPKRCPLCRKAIQSTFRIFM